MLKITSLLVGLFLFFSVAKKADPVNYLDYHKGFIEVETFIANEDFKAAENRLDGLFEEFGVKFAKDLVIAAQLSVLNQHPEKAVTHLIAATQKGVKIPCLKAIGVLKKQLSEADWQKIEAQFPEARKTYLSGIEVNLAQEFHKRYREEQAMKTSPNYGAIVQSNFNKIKELLQQESFPGESLIGIDDAQYAPSLSDCELDNAKILPTLLHVVYPISDIGEAAFVKAIERGELHPHEFATIYNFEKNRVSILYRTTRKTYLPLPDYAFNFPFGKMSDDLERVNADRFKFGICPYEVSLKKEQISSKYGLRLSFGYR